MNRTQEPVLVNSLKSLCVCGLEEMYNPGEQLFCYRVEEGNDALFREGASIRYTIIALLGLYRMEQQGASLPFSVRDQLDILMKKSCLIDNMGDIGLLLWLCALANPDLASTFLLESNISKRLTEFPDARQGKTTELSWLLTGLTYLTKNSNNPTSSLQDTAVNVYEMIKANYGGKGIFGHQTTKTLKGRLRGRIGSFADQVYPIYSFSRFSQTFNNKEALGIALDCGKAICKHQGPLGQWWWHYDAVTGNVIGKYPVYSVHQHSMAPMALFALGEASGLDVSAPIYRGLDWISGNNELGINMIDSNKKVIWRSFYRNDVKMRFEELCGLMDLGNTDREYNDLSILYESRPYCLGWLLYAFADK